MALPTWTPVIQINEKHFDEILAKLETVAAWSPRVISKLESFIRTADDYALFRINALAYAAERGMTESESIDLFLHASKLGLFDLEWNIICSCCGQVFRSLRSMSSLHAHFICTLCGMENETRLDDYIEVSFTISESIRDIKFKHPETLSPFDYAVQFSMTKDVMREPAIGPNPEFMAGFTHVLEYIEPAQSLTKDVVLKPGPVFGGDLIQKNLVILQAGTEASTEVTPIHLSFGAPSMRVSEPETSSVKVEMPTGHGMATYHFQHFAEIPSGPSRWTFENNLDARVCVWVVNPPQHFMSTYVSFPQFLTGKRVLTSQTFRNLYHREVIDSAEGLGIRDVTFLFTDLKGSTALYDQLGDLKAYHLVSQHFDALSKAIAQHSGAVVKTIGDAVMASFHTAADGVRAALSMLRAIEEFNRDRNDKLILKIGLHSGHSIAVTLNDRLDYFGQTVNISARIQALAEANEIYISHDVYIHEGVADILAHCEVRPEHVQVKGVSELLQVYKITVR